MSATQYLLNIGLLAYILIANLGTREVIPRRVVLPILLVSAAAWGFLRHVPTLGNDRMLDLVGVGVGVAFGLLAAALVRVRQGAAGTPVATAGWAFAALWVFVIGGRMAFAYGADHWFPTAIGQFSRTYLITGADAWTAAFVLMALAMVLTRTLSTLVRATRVTATTVQAA